MKARSLLVYKYLTQNAQPKFLAHLNRYFDNGLSFSEKRDIAREVAAQAPLELKYPLACYLLVFSVWAQFRHGSIMQYLDNESKAIVEHFDLGVIDHYGMMLNKIFKTNMSLNPEEVEKVKLLVREILNKHSKKGA